MKLRKINKVLFITLLVFSVCVLNSYPETGAKYIIDNIEANINSLNYDMYLRRMTYDYPNESHALSEGSSYKIAVFRVTVPRSGLFKTTDTKQIYTIEAPTGCSIINVASVDTASKNTKSGNKATLEYTSVGTGNITIKYSCPVNYITTKVNNVDRIVSRININEKITPEHEDSHLYMFGMYDNTLEDYYSMYPLPEGSISSDKKTYILPEDATNKYNHFKSWIEEYMSVYGNTDELKEIIFDYYNLVYKTDSDILDMTKTLDGLTASYDSSTHEYTYTLDDNFIGFALNEKHKAALSQQIYYVSDNSNMTELFKGYLEQYKSYNGYSDEEIEVIKEYIGNKNLSNISCIILENHTYYYTIIVNDSLLSTALIVADFNTKNYIEIPFASRNTMFLSFTNTVGIVYSDIVSSSLVNTVSNDATFFQIISKNYTGTTPTSFSYNFIRYDSLNDWYVMFTISSDGTKNMVTAEKIDIAKLDNAESIAYDNTNKLSIIKILNNSNVSSRLQNIIEALDSIGLSNHSSYYNADLLDYTNNYTFNDPNYEYSSTNIDAIYDGTYYTFTLK